MTTNKQDPKIVVKEETKNRLEKYFIQRKDTYNSVINKLIDLVEEVKKNTK